MPFGKQGVKDAPPAAQFTPPADPETPQAEDKPGDKPKVTRQYTKAPDVPTDILTASTTVDTGNLLPLRTRERTPAQKIVDGDVKETYGWYLADGKPAANQARRKQYNVPPELVGPTRKLLEKAGTHLKYHVDVATGTALASGEVPIQFAARDRQERKPRTASNAA